MSTKKVLEGILCPLDASCMLCDGEEGMGSGTGLCETCRKDLVPFVGMRDVHGVPLYAAFEYKGSGAALIHGLKYENKRYMAFPLTQGLIRAYVQHGLKADGIMAVPLHKKRLKKRGFNQSELLARGLCEAVGVPFLKNVLVRIRDTKQQVGLDEHERLQNVQGAFSTTDDLHEKYIVLIDDVCTTGATLMACAQELMRCGAKVTLLTAAAVEISAKSEKMDREMTGQLNFTLS